MLTPLDSDLFSAIAGLPMHPRELATFRIETLRA